MIRRVLCEGPDDVAALREIATRRYAATKTPTSPGAGAAGEERHVHLLAGSEPRKTIRITAAGGKQRLPTLVANELRALGPQVAGDEAAVEAVWVVFDPDGEPVSRFHEALRATFGGDSPWVLSAGESRGDFVAVRGVERVEVKARAWHSAGPVLDDLADHQSLDRLMCRVVSVAYGATFTEAVERWLREIATLRAGAKPDWKAAVHLWCALVESSASPVNAATRFLGQNTTCKPKIDAVLSASGCDAWLSAIFET